MSATDRPSSVCRRRRSTSSGGKAAARTTSASTAPACASVATGPVTLTTVPSAPAEALISAPSDSISAAICSAVRVRVPCVAMSATIAARPARPRGSVAPPPFSTTAIVATGTWPVRAATTAMPFASRVSASAGGVTGCAAPGAGGAWRLPSGASASGGRLAGGTEAQVGIGTGLVAASAVPAGRCFSSR